jgi:hypothetical protein
MEYVQWFLLLRFGQEVPSSLPVLGSRQEQRR